MRRRCDRRFSSCWTSTRRGAPFISAARALRRVTTCSPWNTRGWPDRACIPARGASG
jgi:hypothetical protein